LAEWHPEPYPIAAVYPSHRHLSAKIRAFLELLIERASPSPPWA